MPSDLAHLTLTTEEACLKKAVLMKLSQITTPAVTLGPLIKEKGQICLTSILHFNHFFQFDAFLSPIISHVSCIKHHYIMSLPHSLLDTCGTAYPNSLLSLYLQLLRHSRC